MMVKEETWTGKSQGSASSRPTGFLTVSGQTGQLINNVANEWSSVSNLPAPWTVVVSDSVVTYL